MELVPAMAESFETNEDATVFTFKLKEGVMFHNGRECTAEDFVYSWNRVCDPATASEVVLPPFPRQGLRRVHGGRGYGAGGCQGSGRLHLRGHPLVSLCRLRVPYRPSRYLTHTQGGSGGGRQRELQREPCGHGTLHVRLVDARAAGGVSKFDDYYGDAAYLDSVVYKIYMEEETAWQDFKAGTLNDCQIPQGQFDGRESRLRRPRALRAHAGYLLLRLQREPRIPGRTTRDLRQALNYAVDRQTLCDVVMEGQR